jgi:hypothetical protein
MDDLKKIAAKIAKCLALATSDNPAEAEAAKRQADALMRKYSLTTADVQAAQANESKINTGGKYRPPVYICKLASIIARAFGCETLSGSGCGVLSSQMIFIGVGIKPELAGYTFDVLRRQLVKDRAAYQATLKRYKRENKTRKADLFCEAWLHRIRQQVKAFAGISEQDKTAIEAYKEKQYGSAISEDNREAPKVKAHNDVDAFAKGFLAAKDVSIHRPMQEARTRLIGNG